jgi:hypothetical protein
VAKAKGRTGDGIPVNAIFGQNSVDGQFRVIDQALNELHFEAKKLGSVALRGVEGVVLGFSQPVQICQRIFVSVTADVVALDSLSGVSFRLWQKSFCNNVMSESVELFPCFHPLDNLIACAKLRVRPIVVAVGSELAAVISASDDWNFRLEPRLADFKARVERVQNPFPRRELCWG